MTEQYTETYGEELVGMGALGHSLRVPHLHLFESTRRRALGRSLSQLLKREYPKTEPPLLE